MHVDDLILVSIDDHVVEPADMFDRTPRPSTATGCRTSSSVTTATRSGCSRDSRSAPWASTRSSVAKEEWGFDPIGFAEMRPARTTSKSACAT